VSIKIGSFSWMVQFQKKVLNDPNTHVAFIVRKDGLIKKIGILGIVRKQNSQSNINE